MSRLAPWVHHWHYEDQESCRQDFLHRVVLHSLLRHTMLHHVAQTPTASAVCSIGSRRQKFCCQYKATNHHCMLHFSRYPFNGEYGIQQHYKQGCCSALRTYHPNSACGSCCWQYSQHSTRFEFIDNRTRHISCNSSTCANASLLVVQVYLGGLAHTYAHQQSDDIGTRQPAQQ
jgi:hypothetical protein